jgi:hypothetical protein
MPFTSGNVANKWQYMVPDTLFLHEMCAATLDLKMYSAPLLP